MSLELTCDKCGNNYKKEKTLRIQYQGKDFSFDSFECAISHIAPRCHKCNSVVIGHGVEHKSEIFCCNHCAGLT